MPNKIKYGDRELDMGDLTLEQAKQLMARHFPELADPEVKKDEKKDGTTYTFTKKAGRKGAARRKGSGAGTPLRPNLSVRSVAGREARPAGAESDRVRGPAQASLTRETDREVRSRHAGPAGRDRSGD